MKIAKAIYTGWRCYIGAGICIRSLAVIVVFAAIVCSGEKHSRLMASRFSLLLLRSQLLASQPLSQVA
ncbi:hypothetical protein VNO78_05670 [Psophocarpus tetragonolobus]|uniref:Uncharacterized protein n=1 Tax=Psophocarpus tetragonolobus TaxID=3891 RepID=A0AAN9SU17_PSOTE